MAKEKKTFRLSERALEIIANRDTAVYATANDFVEKKILESEKSSTMEDVLLAVGKLEKQQEEILNMMRSLAVKNDDFSLPEIYE